MRLRLRLKRISRGGAEKKREARRDSASAELDASARLYPAHPELVEGLSFFEGRGKGQGFDKLSLSGFGLA
jgi:hypothetical protein